MSSDTSIAIAVLLMLAAARVSAVDPFVTDDARVNEPGQCQFETFASGQGREHEHSSGFVLGCTPKQYFVRSEISISANRTDQRTSDGGHGREKIVALQWKALFRTLDEAPGSWGWGAAVGTMRARPAQDAALHHPYLNIIGSAVLGSAVVLHANLGAERDRHAGMTRRTWGAALEASLSERLSAIMEHYRQDEGKPRQQLGLRYVCPATRPPGSRCPERPPFRGRRRA